MGGALRMASSRVAAHISAHELLGIIGFGCFVGWMLLSYYWLFVVLLQDLGTGTRDLVQTFVFVGIAFGYLLEALFAKRAAFNPFALGILLSAVVLAAIMPVCALCVELGVSLPLALMCAVNVLGGAGGSLLTVCWIDVCSRLPEHTHGRMCAAAFLVGMLLFLFATLMPGAYEPALALLYLVPCAGLLYYLDVQRPLARDDAQRTCLDVPAWHFTREVEPSLIVFSMVFAFTFVFLFNYDAEALFIGMLGALVGTIVAVAVACQPRFVGITTAQRALMVVLVLTCLCMPFVPHTLQLVCAALGIAAWAFFMPFNYGHLARKCVQLGGAATFRQVPMCLFVVSLGYVVGWACCTGITLCFGAHSSVFTGVRLALVFVIVLLIMVFFPSTSHHGELADAEASAQEAARAALANSGMSAEDLFEARCTAVAQLYQLSPRETEVLHYLARGRNAAYIEEKLCISSHTVKSHIYNIYRKTDIHAQQSLMDFVESFPLES